MNGAELAYWQSCVEADGSSPDIVKSPDLDMNIAEDVTPFSKLVLPDASFGSTTSKSSVPAAMGPLSSLLLDNTARICTSLCDTSVALVHPSSLHTFAVQGIVGGDAVQTVSAPYAALGPFKNFPN